MALTRPKIGLLGGSFDPVHRAHIMLAETAYQQLDLDSVQLIPAGNPWQRAPLSASKDHRLAMLKLAAGQRSWLYINTIEIDRDGPTYTADTLRQLPADNDYYWILGSDQLANFCTWHEWRTIAQRVHLTVAERPGSNNVAPQPLLQYLQSLNRSIIHLPFSPQGTSATCIRRLLAQSRPTDQFLDPAVAAYIKQHRLYEGEAGSQLTV